MHIIWILVKIFSIKQKNKSNTSSYYRKNQLFSLQEKSLAFLLQTTYNFQFCINIEISNQTFKLTRDYNGEIKLKPFMHISAYPGMLRNYSGILKSLCNLGIFRTMVYSKSETKAYSEPCHTSTMEHVAKIVSSCS